MAQPKVKRGTVKALLGSGTLDEHYAMIAAGILHVFKEAHPCGNPYGSEKLLDINLVDVTAVNTLQDEVHITIKGSIFGFMGSVHTLKLESVQEALKWAESVNAHVDYAKNHKGKGIIDHHTAMADQEHEKTMDKLWDLANPHVCPETSSHPKDDYYHDHVRKSISSQRGPITSNDSAPASRRGSIDGRPSESDRESMSKRPSITDRSSLTQRGSISGQVFDKGTRDSKPPSRRASLTQSGSIGSDSAKRVTGFM